MNEITETQTSENGYSENPEVTSSVSVEAATSNDSKVSDKAWNTAVGEWMNDHIRNSPLSVFSEAWNHLQSALPRLREYLEKHL